MRLIPQQSAANNLSTSLFMNEFSSLLESYIMTGSLLIAVDFNFHFDDTSAAVAANFLGYWNPLICDNIFIAIATELDIPWT